MSTSELQTVIQQIPNPILERMHQLHLSPEAYQENADMLVQFNQIAATMLQDGEGIETPGSSVPLAVDEKMLIQGTTLFCEGLYHAIAKCHEMGIPSDIKQHLLQNYMAMQTLEQAKQIVVSTYGQESTPELQFNHQQQVEMMYEATTGALLHFINEYERENGPIEPVALESLATATLGQTDSPPSEVESPQLLPVQSPEAIPSEQSSAKPPKSQSQSGHEKYGAMALLLTTLPANQRGRILQNFDPQEKELITFYSYPQNLEQNLNLDLVEAHLKRFQELFKSKELKKPLQKTDSARGIGKLVESVSPEELLCCIKDERPVVQRYLQSYGETEEPDPLQPDFAAHSHFGSQLAGARSQSGRNASLPPRIEKILHQYLVKRLLPA